jgi:hypothetical protein
MSLPTVAAVAACAGLVLGPLLLVGRLTAAEPSFVPELTVVNPLVYKVNVGVRAPGDEGWSGLGTVRRETAKTIEQVADEGPLWTFRFTYGGELGGEITMSRDQLRADGWRLAVPSDVGERLREAGMEPSAP